MNKNLRLHTADSFRGMKVLTHHGPLCEQYLIMSHDLLISTMEDWQRILAVRVDLRFPINYRPHGCDTFFDNSYIQDFQKYLKNIVAQDLQAKAQEKGRAHFFEPRFIWGREYGSDSGVPHFHVLILFRLDAYRSLGDFNSPEANMINRIREAWALTLGLHPFEGVQAVHIPDNAEYRIGSDPESELVFRNLFNRVSYMTKFETKNFYDGCHPFGASRKNKESSWINGYRGFY